MNVPLIPDENNPNHGHVVSTEAYKTVVGEKRKLNQATVTEYSSAIRRATKVC
jgi:hypothetical protein